MSALHTRTATMFPPPTIATGLFNFILNNCHCDQIHHHLSSPVSKELMNKKIIHTWKEKASNPLQGKVTHLSMFSLLHTWQIRFTETITKILQKHSNSPYYRLLCASSLFMLLVWKSFFLSLFLKNGGNNKVLLNSTIKFLVCLQRCSFILE